MARPSRYPRRLGLAMSEEMERALDDWRARQPGVPTRVEAVRRLVEIALKAEAENADRGVPCCARLSLPGGVAAAAGCRARPGDAGRSA
jgi:hypothetical protein